MGAQAAVNPELSTHETTFFESRTDLRAQATVSGELSYTHTFLESIANSISSRSRTVRTSLEPLSRYSDQQEEQLSTQSLFGSARIASHPSLAW